jgi:hypothetical protein
MGCWNVTYNNIGRSYLNLKVFVKMFGRADILVVAEPYCVDNDPIEIKG